MPLEQNVFGFVSLHSPQCLMPVRLKVGSTQAFWQTEVKEIFGWTTSNSCILTIDVQAPQAQRRRPWDHWWWGYVVSDGVFSAAAWAILFFFRKGVVEPRRFGMDIDMKPDSNFWLAMAVVPLFWWLVHGLMGMYSDVRRRHRGKELRQVFQAGIMGGVCFFCLAHRRCDKESR